MQNTLFSQWQKDVLSAWSGIRPLVRDPSTIPKGQEASGKTEGLVRSHLLVQSPTGLVTISGGKWTTYREMAQETIDYVVKHFDFGVKRSYHVKPTNWFWSGYWLFKELFC